VDALKHEIVDVEGASFKIVQLPAAPAFDNSTRVLGHISAAFEKLAGLNVAGGLAQLLHADVAMGGAAIKAMCDRLTTQEMEYLRGLLFKNAMVDVDGSGKYKPLLEYMKVNPLPGGVLTLYRLLWVALRLSFGPFGSLASLFPEPQHPSAATQESSD
jgi:hypothetical protein